MKVVYLCSTGTCSSLVAAHLHLGNLNKNATINEILNLPNFSRNHKQIGLSFYIGQDDKEREIYTLGVANEAKIMEISARDLVALFGKKIDIQYVDVSKFVPNYYLWCSAIMPKKAIAKIIKDNLVEIYNIIETSIINRDYH